MREGELVIGRINFLYHIQILHLLQVLLYTAGHINYGGRVTDDWDRRCMMNVLQGFYCKDSLVEEHKYSESGVYYQISTTMDHNVIT